MVGHPELPFGTMLYIRHFEQLPDGRSRIDTVGTRRFQVLEWFEKDGYATGKVAWINDDRPATAIVTATEHADSQEAAAPAAAPEPTSTESSPVAQLRTTLNRFLSSWSEEILARVEAQLGSVPSDDLELPYWCTALFSNGDPRLMHHVAFGEEMRTSAEARVRFAMRLLALVMSSDDVEDQLG